jgi:hypothetical protein
VTRRLGRPFALWMEAWDAVPLFAPLGALPFPPEEPRRRAATVRETLRRMTRDPGTVLLLYPEGVLGPSDAGLAPFRTDFARLARLLPETARWWPVALRVTWWGDARPTALLAGGPLHDGSNGAQRAHLQTLLDGLGEARPGDLADGRAHLLFDGGPDPHTRWDLSRLAPLYQRWT